MGIDVDLTAMGKGRGLTRPWSGVIMDKREHTLAALRGLKPEVQAKFKVKELGLFGSVIRGEERDGSDIDVLVDFDEGASLFDLVGLAQFLEERLQQRVDVVSKRALRPEIREAVLREVATV